MKLAQPSCISLPMVLAMALLAVLPAVAQLPPSHFVPGDELDSIPDVPILKITKRSFNPDDPTQITASASYCDSVVLANVGTATLTIDSLGWADGSPGYRVDPSVAAPFSLEPNQQRAIGVCLEPHRRGVQRDTLLVWSDARTSILVGMMIDISKSMEETMKCDTAMSRLAQAIIQAKKFISRRLLFEPLLDIHDQLMIQAFTSNRSNRYPYPIVADIRYPFPAADFDSAAAVRAMAAVDALAPVGGTPTGEAVMGMMDSLVVKRARNRIIILITDGDANDAGDITVDSMAARAHANGIRIFTIGIDTSSPSAVKYLRDLARKTGGLSRNVADCAAFKASFAAVADSMRRGSVSAEPFAMRVDAELGVDEASAAPEEISIASVTPSPASDGVTIVFRTTRAGVVHLDLHDARGVRVGRAIDGLRYDAGEHAMTVDAGHLPSGFYVARLSLGTSARTRAFTVTN